MPSFDHDGVSLHYATAGRGPPLVLLHGLGSSGEDWAFQIGDFAPHFTLVMPDLRGSGRSDRPRGPYSIATFARDVWALLDALGHRHIDLLGFSLGGAVALEMAIERPQSVGRVVLINALPDYRVHDWRRWLEARVQTTLVALLGARRAARLISKRLFPHAHQAAMRQRVVDVVGANPRASYLATIKALTGWSALDRMDRFPRPTLMIAAEHDYTPLAEKRAYAERLGGALVVIRGSRHGTPFDSIRACNACALAFLRKEAMPADEHLEIDAPEATPAHAPSELV